MGHIQVEGSGWNLEAIKEGHTDAADFIDWGNSQDWLYTQFDKEQKTATLELIASQIWETVTAAHKPKAHKVK